MMAYQILIKIFLVIGFLAQAHAIGEDNDVYYTGEFEDEMTSCPDFVNEFMMLNLTITTSDDDQSPDGMEGMVELNGDITPEVQVSIVVCRYTNTIAGCEFMYTAGSSVCETLTDEQTPWYPFLAIFKHDKCDILKGRYPVTDLKVVTDYVKDVMRHDYVGSYRASLIFEKDGKQIACYDFNVSVVEKRA